MYNIFPQTAARLSQWQSQPDVLGVLLVGSKSRGHADELSDDDLEVLLFIIVPYFKAPLASSSRSPTGSPHRSNHLQENL